MTSSEWDRHVRDWCDSCARRKRCPMLPIMAKDPRDGQCAVFFGRLGRCSQHAQMNGKRS